MKKDKKDRDGPDSGASDENLSDNMNMKARCRRWWRAKRLQDVDPSTTSANSNHYPIVILHTTRSMIKHNMTIKISKLANRL